jgi:hypothetical protein
MRNENKKQKDQKPASQRKEPLRQKLMIVP